MQGDDETRVALRNEPVQDDAFFMSSQFHPMQLLKAAASLRQRLAEFPGRAGKHAFQSEA